MLTQTSPLGQRSSVTFGGKAMIDTEFGCFCFYGFRDDTGREHLALVMGAIQGDDPTPPLCRVHSECLTGEVFLSRRCDCLPQLKAGLQRIAEERRGVLVYLRQEGRGIGLINKLRAYALQDLGADTLDANLHLGLEADLRTYDVAADILRYLEIGRVRLMTNNPDKIEQLEQKQITVTDRIPLLVGVHVGNRSYLATKSKRMRHMYRLTDLFGM